MKKDKTEKKSLLKIKDMRLSDWRGIIAIIIIVGGFATIIICASFGKDVLSIVASSVMTLMAFVAKWYYDYKQKEEEA